MYRLTTILLLPLLCCSWISWNIWDGTTPDLGMSELEKAVRSVKAALRFPQDGNRPDEKMQDALNALQVAAGLKTVISQDDDSGAAQSLQNPSLSFLVSSAICPVPEVYNRDATNEYCFPDTLSFKPLLPPPQPFLS